MNRESAVYPIGLVERLTGLSGRKIRYYERCGLLSPERTEGKHRLYTQGEVDRLQEIKALREQGMNLMGIKTRLAGARGVAYSEGPIFPETADGEREALFAERWERGIGLASIYPVTDQAELERMIAERETE